MDILPELFKADKGYWPNTALVTGLPDVLLDGRNIWNRGFGRWVTAKGFGASGLTSHANPLMQVFNTYGGLSGGGSIAQAFGANIYFYAGVGAASVGSLGIGNAGSSITIWNGSAAFPAGILPPGAPTIG